jgi:GT2 family glycosyltransferase
MEEYPRVGLVSCRLIDGEGKTDTTCSRFPHPLDEMFGYSFLGKLLRRVVPLPWVEKRLRNYHYAGWQRDTIREVEVIPGSFFLGRKKLLEDVGLFDERFVLFYEEPDYGIRARAAGWQTVHVGTVHARHLRAKGLAKLSPLTRYRLGEHDLLAYYRKHFGILWWLILWLTLRPNWLYWQLQRF